MPSTTNPTVEDLFAGLGRGQTTNYNHVFISTFSVTVTALAATTTFVLGATKGPIQIRKIRYTPLATLAAHNDNHWTISVINAGAAGDGSTEIGAISTDANASATATMETNVGLTALVDRAFAYPASPLSIGDSIALKATFTKGGGAANLDGILEVEYLAEI